ncbi:TIGR02444 family protein [Comamonas sp.]|uniref:TIGR02444 family protein n=1 Tax=Comamonas sp. TaxID=34028 RepID=UPI0012C42858|nr:TIGR02444 family protein [Comamonas sp.]MPS92508.1 TIGR02444 family protein [Comamonas sp.]
MNPEQVWKEIGERFADRAYAAELLQRQDQQGLDVVLELFWECALARGIRLSEQARQDAAALVDDWRAEVVQPLRQLRRRMKPLQTKVVEAAGIRAQIQAAELQAERAQIRMLCEWLDAYQARSATAQALGG